jgi:hypothetical protein
VRAQSKQGAAGIAWLGYHSRQVSACVNQCAAQGLYGAVDMLHWCCISQHRQCASRASLLATSAVSTSSNNSTHNYNISKWPYLPASPGCVLTVAPPCHQPRWHQQDHHHRRRQSGCLWPCQQLQAQSLPFQHLISLLCVVTAFSPSTSAISTSSIDKTHNLNTQFALPSSISRVRAESGRSSPPAPLPPAASTTQGRQPQQA